MPRPRTPSALLELRGAYRTHPERRRQDAAGAGPFKREPPERLPPAIADAWRHIVERLPTVAITSTDEIAVEVAARLLALTWAGDADPKIFAQLLQWLGHLGMTPQARTKLPTKPAADSARNPFVDVRA